MDGKWRDRLTWGGGGFLTLWFFVAVDLNKDADTAFIMAAALVLAGVSAWYLHHWVAEVSGPCTAILSSCTLAWLIAVWGLPRMLAIAPLMIGLLGFAAMTVAGFALRRWFEGLYAAKGVAAWQDHSGVIVVAVLVALAALMLALKQGIPLRTVLCIVMLPTVPLLCGWSLLGAANSPSSDAEENL